MEIIDLSSLTSAKILKSDISVDECDQIIASTNITSIVLFRYAMQQHKKNHH